MTAPTPLAPFGRCDACGKPLTAPGVSTCSIECSGIVAAGLAVMHKMRREELTCGCLVRLDESRDLAHFYPCSPNHHAIAQALRKPGSRMVVLAVGTPKP